ncbi:MAG: MFS transporter [Pyrobaculum sp.]
MSLRFIVAASTIGTLIEWYDFFAYASLSPYIASKFFPRGDPVAAVILTWLVFATGFVVRPLGAAVFGHLGDKIGRKSTFLATLLLMGVSTFLIGLLPTYDQVGVWAPLALASLRILQGIALGGEYGGAVTYVLENAPENRRAFYVGFISATSPLGLGLSSLTLVFTAFSLPKADFETWGWRVPFLISLALTALGLWLRYKLAETPLFEKIKKEGRVSRLPIAEAFVRYPVYMALGIIIAAGHSVLAYTATGYIFPYLTNVLKWSPVDANLAVGAAALAQLPFYIINAYLADRIGRRRVYITGLALGLVLFYPVYYWLGFVKDVALASFLIFLLILTTAFTFSVLGTAIAELFPTRVRYTGMSLAFNIGIGLFGGFTPSIVQTLGVLFNNPLAGVILYTYIVVAVALAVAIKWLPETAGVRLE